MLDVRVRVIRAHGSSRNFGIRRDAEAALRHVLEREGLDERGVDRAAAHDDDGRDAALPRQRAAARARVTLMVEEIHFRLRHRAARIAGDEAGEHAVGLIAVAEAEHANGCVRVRFALGDVATRAKTRAFCAAAAARARLFGGNRRRAGGSAATSAPAAIRMYRARSVASQSSSAAVGTAPGQPFDPLARAHLGHDEHVTSAVDVLRIVSWTLLAASDQGLAVVQFPRTRAQGYEALRRAARERALRRRRREIGVPEATGSERGGDSDDEPERGPRFFSRPGIRAAPALPGAEGVAAPVLVAVVHALRASALLRPRSATPLSLLGAEGTGVVAPVPFAAVPFFAHGSATPLSLLGADGSDVVCRGRGAEGSHRPRRRRAHLALVVLGHRQLETLRKLGSCTARRATQRWSASSAPARLRGPPASFSIRSAKSTRAARPCARDRGRNGRAVPGETAAPPLRRALRRDLVDVRRPAPHAASRVSIAAIWLSRIVVRSGAETRASKREGERARGEDGAADEPTAARSRLFTTSSEWSDRGVHEVIEEGRVALLRRDGEADAGEVLVDGVGVERAVPAVAHVRAALRATASFRTAGSCAVNTMKASTSERSARRSSSSVLPLPASQPTAFHAGASARRACFSTASQSAGLVSHDRAVRNGSHHGAHHLAHGLARERQQERERLGNRRPAAERRAQRVDHGEPLRRREVLVRRRRELLLSCRRAASRTRSSRPPPRSASPTPGTSTSAAGASPRGP